MNELVQPIGEMHSAPIDWLWTNNLSQGNLALFDGDPGLGKSMVALDLCARLSTGRPFPDGDMAVPPAAAIFFSAEDSAVHCIRPRLEAMGADLMRVLVVRPEWIEENGGLCFPSNTSALERALADTHARLVIIDPITAFLDRETSALNEMAVRATLTALGRAASAHRAAIVMIRHLSKMSDTSSIYRGTGSIAFQGVCRTSWLFGVDPSKKDRRIMAQVKNNYAPLQASLAFQFENRGAAAAIHWLGASKFSANQLLAAAGRKPDLPGPRERAKEFLLEFLKDGPRPTTEIWPEAQKLGLKQATMDRARKEAHIDNRPIYNGQQMLSYWLLPGQKLPNHLVNKSVPDILELLQPMIEKYPITPLDK